MTITRTWPALVPSRCPATLALIAAFLCVAAAPLLSRANDFEIVAKVGDSVDGHSISSIDNLLSLNNAGDVVFDSGNALLSRDRVLVDNTVSVGGWTPRSFGSFYINDGGHLAFIADISPISSGGFPTGVFATDTNTGTTTAIATPGSTMQGVTVGWRGAQLYGLNNSGDALVGLDGQSNSPYVDAIVTQTETIVMEPGNLVIGPTQYHPESMNDAGTVVYSRRGTAPGLYTQSGLVVPYSGAIIDGHTTTFAIGGEINNAGEVAFAGGSYTSGPDEYRQVFTQNKLLGEFLIETSDGVTELETTDWDLVGFNDREEALVLRRAVENDLSTDQAIGARDVLATQNRIIAQTGDVIDGMTLTSIVGATINDFGEVAFVGVFDQEPLVQDPFDFFHSGEYYDPDTGITAAIMLPAAGERLFAGTNIPVSTDGGPVQAGGIDGIFDVVTQLGVFSSDYFSVPPSEIGDVLADLNAGDTIFSIDSDPVQLWDLKFDGEFTGTVELTFGYDDSGLSSAREAELLIWHFDDGWSPLNVLARDAVSNTITVETTSFSPFMLGGAILVPEPSSALLAVLGTAVTLIAASRRRRRL